MLLKHQSNTISRFNDPPITFRFRMSMDLFEPLRISLLVYVLDSYILALHQYYCDIGML